MHAGSLESTPPKFENGSCVTRNFDKGRRGITSTRSQTGHLSPNTVQCSTNFPSRNWKARDTNHTIGLLYMYRCAYIKMLFIETQRDLDRTSMRATHVIIRKRNAFSPQDLHIYIYNIHVDRKGVYCWLELNRTSLLTLPRTIYYSLPQKGFLPFGISREWTWN